MVERAAAGERVAGWEAALPPATRPRFQEGQNMRTNTRSWMEFQPKFQPNMVELGCWVSREVWACRPWLLLRSGNLGSV